MADYCTLAEMRDYLRITAVADTDDNAEIALAITAASRSIDRATNRTFGVAGTATARYYTAVRENGRYVVPIHDLQTISDLVVATDTVGDDTYASTVIDYTLGPLNAVADGLPWTRLTFDNTVAVPIHTNAIRITAKWGWTAVPSGIKWACQIQAARYFKRRDAPFGIAGSVEMGSELRLFSRLDPDVEMLVGDYRRWWAAA